MAVEVFYQGPVLLTQQQLVVLLELQNVLQNHIILPGKVCCRGDGVKWRQQCWLYCLLLACAMPCVSTGCHAATASTLVKLMALMALVVVVMLQCGGGTSLNLCHCVQVNTPSDPAAYTCVPLLQMLRRAERDSSSSSSTQVSSADTAAQDTLSNSCLIQGSRNSSIHKRPRLDVLGDINQRMGFSLLAAAVNPCIPPAEASPQQQKQQPAAGAATVTPVTYMIVPVSSSSFAPGPPCVDWGAISALSSGLQPALEAVGLSAGPGMPAASQWEQQQEQHDPLQAHQQQLGGSGVAAPSGSSAGDVLQRLVGRVVLTQHTCRMYRVVGVSQVLLGSEQARLGCQAAGLLSADSILGLRHDLPLLEVAPGRHLQCNCLQPGSSSSSSSVCEAPPSEQPRGPVQCHHSSSSSAHGVPASSPDCTPDVQQQQQQQPQAALGREQPNRVLLPADLCWLLPLPLAAWQQLVLVPCFMYRVESLLRLHLAGCAIKQMQMQQQQQQEGDMRMGDHDAAMHVDSNNSSSTGGNSSSLSLGAAAGRQVLWDSLLLCALTSRGCREAFSLERLEHLGDTLLKFLTTLYLLHTKVSHASRCSTASAIHVCCCC
jgi:hypothetical protein